MVEGNDDNFVLFHELGHQPATAKVETADENHAGLEQSRRSDPNVGLVGDGIRKAGVTFLFEDHRHDR
jgi:hypothetical protein